MMGYGWNGMGWGGWGPWGGVGLIGSLVSVLLWIGFLAVLVAGITWLAQRSGRQNRPSKIEEPSLSEIRRRLASGEITTSEYDTIVQRLHAKVRAPD